MIGSTDKRTNPRTGGNRGLATAAVAVFVIAIVAVAIWAMTDRDVQSIDAPPEAAVEGGGAGSMQQTVDPAVPSALDPATRPADQPVATE